MASIVWGRDPQEAHDNPYEYDAQDQFVREAKELLSQLQLKLDRFTMAFHRDDETLEKATWMLALDLIDALLESVHLFEEKRHRIASRLFRDAVETIDFLQVLHSSTPRAEKALRLWYEDETIPHIESRRHIEKIAGSEAAFKRRDYYVQLSKFTHRTYRALLKSFSLGRGNMLVHDSHSMSLLVLPHTIASGLAVLADLISQATECLKQCGPLDPQDVENSWLVAIELHTVPRRFEAVHPLGRYK
ncbi:MAG: hypothetical protein NTY70_02610 [Burkholderiales bacterium]|nr:hypothetical protein [Burkholderiales bacterium]